MARREFLRALGAAGIALTLPTAARAERRADKRPNIILFITDDQDKHSIGAYGGDSLTSNLDRMASEGMVFHQAYVSSTVCTPSRYSFLTGRYAGRSYSKRYEEECPPGMQGFPSFNVELEKDNMNVGAVLQKSGYVTGYVGKFHVGPDIKRADEYETFGLRHVSMDAWPSSDSTVAFRHNEQWYREFLKRKGFSWAKHIYWGNLQKPFNHHNPEWTIEAALEFIEENRDRPFYLHYCTTLVHGPPKSWRTSMDHPRVSGEGLLDKPSNAMTDRKVLLQKLEAKGLDPAEGHAGYAWVDDSVGAILKKLDELGIADNTLIVFTSDHGSRMKGSLYSTDGTCVPPLFGRKRPRQWRDRLYFEVGSARAVCTKDWKYIAVRYPKERIEQIKKARPDVLPKLMAYIGRMGIGTRGAQNPGFFEYDQLYEVKQDPKERQNLAGNPEYRERLARMRGMLREDLESFGRPFGEFVPGGNAAPAGLIDEQIRLVQKMKIVGKKVILPDGNFLGERSQPDRKRKLVEREKRRVNPRRRKKAE